MKTTFAFALFITLVIASGTVCPAAASKTILPHRGKNIGMSLLALSIPTFIAGWYKCVMQIRNARPHKLQKEISRGNTRGISRHAASLRNRNEPTALHNQAIGGQAQQAKEAEMGIIAALWQARQPVCLALAATVGLIAGGILVAKNRQRN